MARPFSRSCVATPTPLPPPPRAAAAAALCQLFSLSTPPQRPVFQVVAFETPPPRSPGPREKILKERARKLTQDQKDQDELLPARKQREEVHRDPSGQATSRPATPRNTLAALEKPKLRRPPTDEQQKPGLAASAEVIRPGAGLFSPFNQSTCLKAE